MAMWKRIAICFGRNWMVNFTLYHVDMKYIRNLHKLDDKVLSVSPQTGKANRVFVGTVTVCESHKYCIPLSSPKEKHKHMRNSMDFSKIVVDGKLLGVLNFNLMIPVEEAQLQPVNLRVYKRDREAVISYKGLCQKELDWCCAHSELICNKSNVLYRLYISGKDFRGRDRCLNFGKMESACCAYNMMHTE